VRSAAFAAVFICGILAACSSRRVFTFTPSPEAAGPAVAEGGVVVREWADQRGRRPLDHNLKILALIPLVPFSASYRDYPERTYFDDSKNLNGFLPETDLAEALAREVGAQRVFERCQYIPGFATHERYELRGALKDCHVTEGYLTYGISFLSVVLHAVGFPEGTLRCGISMHLELHDHREGKVIWSKDAAVSGTRATWIYDSAEADHACELFGDLAGELLRPAVAEMKAAVASRPAAIAVDR
jgi:hypothetical protein